MSGAFNIDIEVGEIDGSRIRIYCASLTDEWTVDRTKNEVAQFRLRLRQDEAIKKNKVIPGPIEDDNKRFDLSLCEVFLSRLGCTSAVLRVTLFHEFLNIPQSVRDGLTYASHKPFGKTLREGAMQKHPRYVRKGGQRYVRLTRDERGGSLILYKDETKQGVIASIKIGASTQIQNLKDKGVPNAFVVKSGKRQWVLAAQSPKNYQQWQLKLDEILKQFGSKVSGGAAEEKDDGDAGSNIVIGIGPTGNKDQMDKYQDQNMKLRQELDALTSQMEGMQKELDRLKVLHAEAGAGQDVLKKKVDAEFAKEKAALIRDYDLQSQNLENELQELHRRIDAKTAMDTGNGGGGMKGFSLGKKEDLKCEIDREKQFLDTLTEDRRDEIKFMHKHLHRHTHKHVHTHKHIHLHKDAADNVDNVNIEDFDPEDKHTISHTITHSNTQFEIKGNPFF